MGVSDRETLVSQTAQQSRERDKDSTAVQRDKDGTAVQTERHRRHSSPECLVCLKDPRYNDRVEGDLPSAEWVRELRHQYAQ